MQNWKIIEESKVRCWWRCSSCEYDISVDPSWYQSNGTPMCTDCDDDMCYLCTEIDNG
jgi:hypothetical protein